MFCLGPYEVTVAYNLSAEFVTQGDEDRSRSKEPFINNITKSSSIYAKVLELEAPSPFCVTYFMNLGDNNVNDDEFSTVSRKHRKGVQRKSGHGKKG